MGGCQNWHPGAGQLLALGSPGAHLQSDYLGLALLGKAVVGGLPCCAAGGWPQSWWPFPKGGGEEPGAFVPAGPLVRSPATYLRLSQGCVPGRGPLPWEPSAPLLGALWSFWCQWPCSFRRAPCSGFLETAPCLSRGSGVFHLKWTLLFGAVFGSPRLEGRGGSCRHVAVLGSALPPS